VALVRKETCNLSHSSCHTYKHVTCDEWHHVFIGYFPQTSPTVYGSFTVKETCDSRQLRVALEKSCRVAHTGLRRHLRHSVCHTYTQVISSSHGIHRVAMGNNIATKSCIMSHIVAMLFPANEPYSLWLFYGWYHTSDIIESWHTSPLCATWYSFFICVTWLDGMCYMTRYSGFYVWHDPMISLVYMFETTRCRVATMHRMLYVWHNGLHDSVLWIICVTWLDDMTGLYVWHDSMISHVYMCDMTRWYYWFICVTWLDDITRVYVWHDSMVQTSEDA